MDFTCQVAALFLYFSKILPLFINRKELLYVLFLLVFSFKESVVLIEKQRIKFYLRFHSFDAHLGEASEVPYFLTERLTSIKI